MQTIMRHIIASLALVAAVAAGSTAAMAQCGGDTGEGASCAPGRFCIFENRSYNEGPAANHKITWDRDENNYNNVSWPGTSDSINDETSSYYNATNCTVVVYQDDHYRGGSYGVPAGGRTGNMDGPEPDDNSMSSHQANCLADDLTP
jgi:hypothetical protein